VGLAPEDPDRALLPLAPVTFGDLPTFQLASELVSGQEASSWPRKSHHFQWMDSKYFVRSDHDESSTVS
jgi:hypothetical protein